MSGWNDGVSKQLADFFNELGNLGDIVQDCIKEQIDYEVNLLKQNISSTTPRGKTLGLWSSLSQSQITARYNWYGWSVTFEGENEKGVPYQKIANILNYGTSHIQGTRFISKAIRKLKNMDDRILERIEKKTQNLKT